MIVVRLYCKCEACGKVEFLEDNKPSILKYKYCSDCRPFSKRVAMVARRIGSDVDFLYIKSLLSKTRCTYCNRELSWEERQIEHKVPVARGGGNDNSNLCLSCKYCNYDKGNMTYDEYMEYKELNPFMPGRYHRDMALKHLSQFKLYDEKISEDRTVKRIESCESIYKTESVYDESGRLKGLKKITVSTDIIVSRTHSVRRTLTKDGEIYNVICKLYGKPEIQTEEYLDI